MSIETRIQQKNSWDHEIDILKDQLKEFTDGYIFFEYTIPRMGKRVDTLLLYKNIIFVLEFKCGDSEYRNSTYDQVYDYALDLQNFHKESHNKLIVPIMVSTSSPFVENEINVANWFLNGKDDVRSSYSLEDVVTEFDIQGLEIDYSLIAWDADLRFNGNTWSYYNFVGNKWNVVRSEEKKLYLKNAYRVLLTRARQGMVIFIPEGSDTDETRKREYYDKTYEYLKIIGINEI